MHGGIPPQRLGAAATRKAAIVFQLLRFVDIFEDLEQTALC